MQFITPLAPAYAEIFLLCMACVILLLDLFLRDDQRGITYALSLATLGGCFLITLYFTITLYLMIAGGYDTTDYVYTFSNMFVADLMASVLKLGIYITLAVVMVYSQSYIRLRDMLHGEFFVLSLTAMLL